jgi:hypothetical protein
MTNSSNNLLPIQPDRRQRNIRFANKSKSTERKKLTNEENHKIQLKNLVESPSWAVLCLEAESFVDSRVRDVPSGGSVIDLIGYHLGTIVRDVLREFIERVEEKANAAPDPANYLPNDNCELII